MAGACAHAFLIVDQHASHGRKIEPTEYIVEHAIHLATQQKRIHVGTAVNADLATAVNSRK
jgi:hypothetical protein